MGHCALHLGAAQFKWNERVAAGPQRNGAKVRGIGVGISSYSGHMRTPAAVPLAGCTK